MEGKIQTVLGDIEPGALGRTLTHEHLCIDATALGLKPPPGHEHMATASFKLENFGWIQQYPYSHPENLDCITSEIKKSVIEELKTFRKLGGGTIVENTIHGLSRNVNFLVDVSKQTGVNIVAGTGYYTHNSHSQQVLAMTEEDICNVVCKEITEGCREQPNVKCGLLGEIGNSWPITDFEKKSLRGSGMASQQLGCPAMIHPGRNPKAPEEAVRIFSEAGGNVRKLVMGHIDRTIQDDGELVEFAKMGSYIEYDLFGTEKSYYQHKTDVDMPSDAQRIEKIKMLLDEGLEDRILIAHDIHTRHRMSAYGGHGYSHILSLIVPMMLERGISQDQIDKILISNPAKWLAF